ncbi:MAG: hypothetical protein NVS3B18_11850 [Candidatus Dormibacteria bacterium]
MQPDSRRSVPATDAVLADPRLAAPQLHLGRPLVRSVVRSVQSRVRDGDLDPDDLVSEVLAELPAAATTLRTRGLPRRSWGAASRGSARTASVAGTERRESGCITLTLRARTA